MPDYPLWHRDIQSVRWSTLFRLLAEPDRYRAGVVSGAPLVPIPEMLDADTSIGARPVVAVQRRVLPRLTGA